jgi:hypothetical protein
MFSHIIVHQNAITIFSLSKCLYLLHNQKSFLLWQFVDIVTDSLSVDFLTIMFIVVKGVRRTLKGKSS